MTDRIEIRSLRVLGTHGALAHERTSAQPFELDIDIETDFTRPTATDELTDAVDYAVVIASAVSIVEGSSFRLLEALGSAVATALLVDERIEAVTVSIRKLRPPVSHDVATTGVVVYRSRHAPVA